ncbi:hypothetical protein DBT_1246 [Dissulfuribacter thermophilus]|uniref:Phosphate-selective porin O and P n=1 Tax=Dissulfuribacter thermophilus TaxID=1156395 RepID=A0A1B9F6D9_9BACT|nr:porin [Dissulfuribacter thermophilus]OCC15499.1 hypothetical protein DBT_1246 [Dissulfuribacter thermophilus]
MKIKLKKRTILIRSFVVFAITLFFSVQAMAACWLRVQGTETWVKNPKSFSPWGFVQPTYYQSQDDVDPYADVRKDDFNIRRARLGVRGIVPNTDGRVNYFVLGEFGRNGVTENPNGDQGNFAALTDASVTLNYIPGMRLRLGQFKLPMGIDGLQAIHLHNYIEFSDVFFNLMLERFGKNRSVSAYRDIGVEIFDWFRFGQGKQYELAYALMLSNGNGINSQDNDRNKDIAGKIVVSRIFNNTKGPFRQEIHLGLWFINGKRTGFTFATPGPVNGEKTEQDRKRYGIEFYFKKDLKSYGALRVVTEGVWGNGWVYAPGFFNGAVPVSNRYFTDNTSVSGHGVPHADLDAFGWYIDLGYRPPVFNKKLELDFRYSYYDPDNGNDLSVDVSQDNLTLGLQYFFHKRARATVNYEIRDSHWNPAIDNRFMAQVTVVFK